MGEGLQNLCSPRLQTQGLKALRDKEAGSEVVRRAGLSPVEVGAAQLGHVRQHPGPRHAFQRLDQLDVDRLLPGQPGQAHAWIGEDEEPPEQRDERLAH